MARRATIDDIRKGGETELVIPGITAEDGEALTVRVRKVHAGERNALLPAAPGHLFDKLPEDPEQRTKTLAAREAAWLNTLSPDQLSQRRLEAADFCCRLVSLAALDPPMTIEDARALGDGALSLAAQILEFSKNQTAPAPVAEELDQAPAAPESAAA